MTMVAPEPMYRCPDDDLIGPVPESELSECEHCAGSGIDGLTLRRFDEEVACRGCDGLGKVIGYRPNGLGAIGCRTLRAVRIEESCADGRGAERRRHASSAGSLSCAGAD